MQDRYSTVFKLNRRQKYSCLNFCWLKRIG
jgi:hypothetical protein